MKETIELVTKCEHCGVDLPGYKAEMCCPGLSNECGCMGLPIDPPWCGDCWDRIMNKPPAQKSEGEK